MKRRFFVAAATAATWCVAVTLTVLPSAALSGENAVYGGVTTGLPAPDFTLIDSRGVTHALSDFVGQTVVLEWTNKDCLFVKKFYDGGAMQGWQRQVTEADAIWLTLSSSAISTQGHMSPEDWNQYIETTDIRSTAVLLDEDGTVGKRYAAQTTPHIYVIDPEGVLRYQGAIDDAPSTDPADIAQAKNYLVTAFSAIMVGDPVQVNETEPYGCDVQY